jgi:hexosaminidase
MNPSLILLPQPRRIEWLGGTCDLRLLSVREATEPSSGRAESYTLTIDRSGVSILAGDAAGAFYARQTLQQISRQQAAAVPCLRIEDWPDFRARGVMIDISRDKVPSMQTLLELVDLFAHLKLNQLQLYTEHTFAYSEHRQVWEHASPMTAEELRQLDAYCRQRHIELVPNQNSFGHMERWLKYEHYKPLAECPEGFMFPWGFRHEGGFSLNPLNPRSLELIEGLYDELLPNFSSRLFNVGCDETFDLGLGKSKAECERRGKERVYLEFLLKIHHAVTSRGRQMQFWGDIILHKPELIRELPRDMIALNWGYDHDHPFPRETQAFADAGLPFYVCPGTSSWCSITGKTDNALANLRSAAENGLKNGAAGYLNTDWGDWGHLQYLPISYLGFAFGAALSWCFQTNRDLPLAAALDLHVFADTNRVMGGLMHDLGNVYQAVQQPLGNSTRLFWALVGGPERKKLYEMVTRQEYDDAEARIDAAIAPLGRVSMQRPDAERVGSELHNAAAMLRHACRRGRWLLDPSAEPSDALAQELRGIMVEHRRLWLARNRPGGLEESLGRLEKPLADYPPEGARQ